LQTLSLVGCTNLLFDTALDLDLVNLTRLELQQTRLSNLDLTKIAKSKAFKHLEFLNVSQTGIESLKPLLESIALEKLEYLIANGNKIASLPRKLQNLQVVKSLKLIDVRGRKVYEPTKVYFHVIVLYRAFDNEASREQHNRLQLEQHL